MTSWERFQKLNSTVRTTNQKIVNSHFLFKGYPSIEINLVNSAYNPLEEALRKKPISSDETLQAVVVNKQEQDHAYIYTHLDDPIDIGSVWAAKDLHLLVSEEIVIIKDVNWHKYYCLLCNLNVDGLWGFFLGPEKSHINLNLKKDVVLVSQQKPLLVLPSNFLSFQDKIMINGRAWIVDEYDAISNPGITYYSLMPTTMSKETIEANRYRSTFVEFHEEPTLEVTYDKWDTDAVEITPNSQITINTEDGYFKVSNKAVQILKHTATEVIFQVPFGIENLEIQYKENDKVKERIYKIGY